MAARDGDEADAIPDEIPEADALEIGDPHDGCVVLSLHKGGAMVARLVLDRDDLRELAVHLYAAYELIEEGDDTDDAKPDDVAGHA